MTGAGHTAADRAIRSPGEILAVAKPYAVASSTAQRLRSHENSSATIGQLIVTLVMVLGIVFVVAGRGLLPDRYSYDEQKIQQIALGQQSFESDQSFQLVGVIYRETGLSGNPTLAGLIGIAAYYALLVPLLRPRVLRVAGVTGVVLLCGAVVFGAVYIGHYSKEVFLLPVVALFLRRDSSRKWEGVLVLLLVGYGLGFRTYWLLVACLYCVVRIAMSRQARMRSVAIWGFAGLVVLALGFHLFMGVELDHYRVQVNAYRMDAVDASSLIEPILPIGGAWGGLVNSALTLVALVVPLPLLLMLKAFYVIVAGYLVVMWSRFGAGARRIIARGKDARINRLVAVVVSFVVIQSVFEPDYGSYVRHLTPLLPAVLTVAFSLVHSDDRGTSSEALKG